jgi:hypothetical protein
MNTTRMYSAKAEYPIGKPRTQLSVSPSLLLPVAQPRWVLYLFRFLLAQVDF